MGSQRSGLENVVMGETRLTNIDGDQGKLVFCGHSLKDIAPTLSFPDLLRLLWHKSQYGEALEDNLGRARLEAHALLSALEPALMMPNTMDALRTCISHIKLSSKDTLTPFEKLVGAMPVFTAAIWRRQQGLSVVKPDVRAAHTQDCLTLLKDKLPAPAVVKALETYLVTVSDHGMNASTFTARVIASTQSDPISAITGAIGALKGPLHGGAPGPVLDMLDDIAQPENAEPWILNALANKKRIMGMGHRVYRVRDPRAAVLEKALQLLNDREGETPRLQLARAVETTAERILAAEKPGRKIRANVEFYTAILLEAVGIPRALFSLVFASGRVAGWCAHYQEQMMTGRLIRPQVQYVGD